MTPANMNDEDFEQELMHLLREPAPQAGDGTEHAPGPANDTPTSSASNNPADAVELAALANALGSYRRQSLEWAQQRSAAMPPPVVHARPAWLDAPQWALGTIGFCACVIGGALYTHHQATLSQQAAVALPAAPSSQLVAQDNELMLLVDDALRNQGSPTEQDLGLNDGLANSRAQQRHAAPQQTN